MTIKAFAQLCGCNPQTLRYYDQKELLKPDRIDPWSGYRYYREEQALTFVRIKDLQLAGFTIEEIKALLDQDDEVIHTAIEEKIEAMQAQIKQMKQIQAAYRADMMKMKQTLELLHDKLTHAMNTYDASREFGIDEETYLHIIGDVNTMFEKSVSESEDVSKLYDMLFSDDSTLSQDDDLPGHEDIQNAEAEFHNLLNDRRYQLIYEKHDWDQVKDLISELPVVIGSRERTYLFSLIPGKAHGGAFLSTFMMMICDENKDKPIQLNTKVIDSSDGKNHLWVIE